MTLVPVDINKFGRSRSKSDIFGLLMEFQENGESCAEVVDYPHKSAKNCVNSIYTTIKRCRLFTIAVSQRGDKVFLIRKEI